MSEDKRRDLAADNDALRERIEVLERKLKRRTSAVFSSSELAGETPNDTRVQEALRAADAANARYRALVELAPDAIFALRDGVVRFANPAAAEMLGYGSLEDRRLDSLVDESDVTLAREMLEAHDPGDADSEPREVGFVAADGTLRPLEVSTRVVDDDGQTVVLVIARDLTERKAAQSRAAHAERMASLGTMAAGVAHAINNPLAYVIANLDVVIEELREVHRQRNAGAIEELLEAATEARAGANEARKVVRSLKAFARSEDDQRSPQDVHQLLDQAIELTRNETRHRAKVVKAYGDLARVNADPSKLTQVFVHLLVNAAQALDGGRAHQNWIRIDTYSGEDGSAVIEVSDSGPGIAAPLLPRVFEPFLTTRPVGQGSGLGLAVSHGIVSSLAGQISAENLDGGGACIRVTLPAAAFDESARHSSMAPASSGVPEGTVLVIDDDVRVGRSLRRVLQRHHHVTVVERGSDALELIRAGQQFDVILCDLMMPEMTGMELFRELERYAPDVTHDVIFITGGAFSAEAEAFLARVPNQVIEKPFDPRNLRATIRTNVLLRRGGSDRSSSLG